LQVIELARAREGISAAPPVHATVGVVAVVLRSFGPLVNAELSKRDRCNKSRKRK
jgi:hypothetical protein